MKVVHNGLGFIAGVAMIIILLISSFEIAAYSDFGWYEKEYEKYDVLSDLEMEMNDVMEVTEEMMAYLRGNREDLVVNTVIDGQEREFFNDREKAHMLDVQKLFLGGLTLRRISVAIVVVSIAVILFTKGDWKKVLPKTFLASTGLVIGATACLGILCAKDFHKYLLFLLLQFWIYQLRQPRLLFSSFFRSLQK